MVCVYGLVWSMQFKEKCCLKHVLSWIKDNFLDSSPKTVMLIHSVEVNGKWSATYILQNTLFCVPEKKEGHTHNTKENILKNVDNQFVLVW